MPDAPIYEIDINQFKKDPYPDLKAMRESTPICFVPQLNATMICKRDAIFECEKNTEIFSSVQPNGLMTVLMGQNMMRKDGSDHMSERKTIFKTISPKTAADHWLKEFQIIAENILNRLSKKRSGDLLEIYARELSAESLKKVTGLNNMTASEMDRVSQGMIDGCANYVGDPAVEENCHDCTDSIDKHIDEIIAELGRKTDYSLISTMIEGGLSKEQISANVKLAISGGQNEPRDAIAGCIWAVLNFKLKDELIKKEYVWKNVFDEYCRWMSPIGMSPREIKVNYKYKNINLYKGDRIFLMFSSANRDERYFSNPEIFDINRDNSKSIHFGAGPHYCAGASIANTMISQVALPMLFACLPDIKLTRDCNFDFDGWAFRAITSLECEW